MTHEEIIAAVESMTVLELADLVGYGRKVRRVRCCDRCCCWPRCWRRCSRCGRKDRVRRGAKSFDAAAKLKVLKLVREVCGLGLKEAKDFVEAVAAGPKTVKEGLSKEDADKMAAQFKEVGGECEIK